MAKKDSLTDKTPAELKEMLAEKREALRDLRFSAFAARVKDTNAQKKTRKEVARVLTALTAKKKTA